MLGLMSTTEAADLLGKTSERVRQMVDAGELARVPLPGRTMFVWRSQVERLVEQRAHRQRGEFYTPALAEVPVPEAPRALVYDRIFTLRTRLDGSGEPAHLRVWEGDDGWSVVLLGTPDGGVTGNLISRAPLTVESILQLRPTLDLRRTAFVELYPNDLDSLGDGYLLFELSQPVRVDRTGTMKMERGRTSMVSFEALEAALGERPVLWHRQAYRSGSIEAYQRRGLPIDEVVDRYHLRQRVREIQAARSSNHPDRDLVLNILAVPARMVVNDSVPHWVPPGAEIDGYRYPWVPQASTLVELGIPAEVKQLGQERGERLDWPLTEAQVREMRCRLVSFAEDTDQYQDGHDEDLHRAVQAALANLHYITGLDPDVVAQIEAEIPYPQVETLMWMAGRGDTVTAQYLEGSTLASDGADLSKADTAKLTEALDRADPSDVQMGRDPSGCPVAVWRRSGQQDRVAAVLPRRMSLVVQADDVLVSGRIDTGHVPLYVERGGRVIAVATPSNSTSQMNYGYGGGSPGASEATIRELLISSGHEVTDQVATAVRRFTEDPRWEEGTYARVRVGDLLAGEYTPGHRAR